MLLSLPNLGNSIKHENKIQVLIYHVSLRTSSLSVWRKRISRCIGFRRKNGEQIYQGRETVILQALCSYLKNHIMADKAFG